jgi:thiosulfate dehydrogenase [quinone] large subunit
MTALKNRQLRQAAAGVAALIGGYLLYLGANPQSDFATALIGFWLGVLLFGATGWFLLRYYHPGAETPSADEVDAGEWRFIRFLRQGREAAPLYLGLRLFLALEWIQAGLHKLGDPGWTQTGVALKGYWTSVVAVPTPPASAAITFPAYRAFIQFMLDNGWFVWFAKVVTVGELLIGLGFLFGGLVGFAAFFALLMNFAFMFAGTTSVNPMLVLLETMVLLGWRTAGWWGIDRILLPRAGTPWARAKPGGEARPAPAS